MRTNVLEVENLIRNNYKLVLICKCLYKINLVHESYSITTIMASALR